jgi:hypothetical protein
MITSAVGAAALEQTAAAQSNTAGPGAPVRWLDGTPPAVETGVTFGVPWPRGTVRNGQSFALVDASGKPLPAQTWNLAYWPDGSIKFTGVATVAGPTASAALRLAPGAAAAPSTPLSLTQSATSIGIDTGKLQCRIAKQGAHFIEAMTADNREVARDGRLVCSLEDRSQPDTIHLHEFTSNIKNVTVEQSGPVRAVVKIEGVHSGGGREWLPFTLRLYFYAGLDHARLIHSIVFDGDEQKDFIRSLGVVFTVPMREQLHNRHVRFSGEGEGLWSEPIEPATGRRTLPGGFSLYADQLAGKRIPNKETFNAAGQKLLSDWATWDAYKLVQPTADGFTIQKRTNAQSCWLDAAASRRASGLVFAGDVSGGLAIAVKNFWQSCPASLEVQKATTPAADIYAWLWSPDAPVMDLRHYDTRAHDLDSSYEDVQPGFSTPHGVGRTSELMLFAAAAVPARAETAQQAKLCAVPSQLVPTPEHIHAAGVFGIWSLPDRSTPQGASIEDQLDAAFALYHKEVDQQHWYGFWNYGDVMHQHDGPRHMWRYDIGGFAWDNTELGTPLWLWYAFLRSGRADVFRMAEAMSRHTSEVDVYHLGRFAPLGSRHNVRHWGCGAKEPRISQAPYHRVFYYLTADERMGELFHAVNKVDITTVRIDTMREAAPLTKPLPYPGRVRGGPDWLAFIGNWMTEWERTGDTKWRDKIVAGMESIAQMPYGFMTGPQNLYGYDPATGKLYPLEEDGFGTYNLTVNMGGPEVVFELNELIDNAAWHKTWLQYCRLHNARKDVVKRDMETGAEGADASFSPPGRLAAYVYLKTKNQAFAQKAMAGIRLGRYANTTHRAGPEVLNPIDEVTGMSTNSTAQGCLEAIEILEMLR